MDIPFIIGGILAVVLLRALVRRLLYPRPLPGIPFDKEAAKRIAGDLPTIAAVYKELTEWSTPIGRRSLQFGSPIHQLFMNPFTKPIVMVDDPREVSDIALRRSKEFDRSTATGIWQTFIPYSTIAQSTTPEWRAQRKTWQDTMHPDFLRRVVAKNIYASAKDLTKLWEVRYLHSSGHPVDVSGDFSFAALDAIWTATFGERLDTVKAQIQMLETGKTVKTKGLDMHSTVGYINDLANAWRGSFWPALTQWRIQRSSNYRRYMEVKDREVDRILLDASARFQQLLDGSSDGDEHDTCAMDLVLRRNMLAAQKAGKPLPDPTKDVRLRDELLLFIYAVSLVIVKVDYHFSDVAMQGHDTTSITCMYQKQFLSLFL